MLVKSLSMASFKTSNPKHSFISCHRVTHPTFLSLSLSLSLSSFLNQSQSPKEDTYDPPFSFTSKTLNPNDEIKGIVTMKLH
ncbi:hypothetical protein LOK49_LG06G00515 [Camellia lanceoleosa]|uniref:Uncharacterized protein n=1 Tax=Camellia lanceoleosa TaxID=1840588 RepID=A0ACC0HAI4_9ERIC|nr:hypothetical protein LOK49_LG06G00515 [Camellia lanceoleosa]